MAMTSSNAGGSTRSTVQRAATGTPSAVRHWLASICVAASFTMAAWLAFGSDSSVADDAWQHGVVLLPPAFVAIVVAWHFMATCALLQSSGRQPRFLRQIAMLTALTAFVLSLPSIIVCAWMDFGTPLQAFTSGLLACMALTVSSVPCGALWWAMAMPGRR